MTSLRTGKFDYNLIRFLVAIIDTNSMVNAAEVLDVAPSAVSYAVRKLREHYNDPLFVRALHGVTPTALALNIYERFKIINDDINDALNIVNDVDADVREIYIRADAFTEAWITDRLIRCGIVPNDCILDFRYSSASSDERVAKLRNGEVDLDIGVQFDGDKNILSTRLFEWDLMLVCRKDHKTIGDSLSREQYANEPFIAYSTRHYGTILLSDINQITQVRDVKPIARSESPMNMIFTALLHDLIIFIPRTYFQLLQHVLPIKEVHCDFIPYKKIQNVIHIHKRNINDALLQKIITVLKTE